MKTANKAGGEPAQPNVQQLILAAIVLVVVALLLALRGRYNRANLAMIDGIFNQDTARLAAATDLLTQGDDGPRTPDWLTLLYFEQGEFENALAQYELATADESPAHSIYQPNTSEYWILEGMLAAKAADFQTAVAHYRYALSLHPQRWQTGLYELYYAALRLGAEPAEAQVAQTMLDALAGNAISADYTPLIPLAPHSACSQLTAFQYDPAASAAGPLVPVVFHFADGTQAPFVLINLIPNAGFEWAQRNGQIVGFEKSIYLEDDLATTHQLAQAATAVEPQTTVALLTNSDASPKTSYQSFAIEITSAAPYFFGGWGANEANDAPVDLGVGWYGRGLPDVSPYRFLPFAPQTTWQFVHDVGPMPAVPNVDFVIANQHATNQAATQFDDLFFFRIDPQTCYPADTIGPSQ